MMNMNNSCKFWINSPSSIEIIEEGFVICFFDEHLFILSCSQFSKQLIENPKVLS